MSTNIDPSTISLILSGKKPFGAGGDFPEDGLINVDIVESIYRSSRRDATKAPRWYLSLKCLDGNAPDYEIFENMALPTNPNEEQKKREIAERKMKSVLVAAGNKPEQVAALTGNAFTVANLIEATKGRNASIYYYRRVKKSDGEYTFHDVIFLTADDAKAIRAGTKQPPARFNTDTSYHDNKAAGGGTALGTAPSGLGGGSGLGGDTGGLGGGNTDLGGPALPNNGAGQGGSGNELVNSLLS